MSTTKTARPKTAPPKAAKAAKVEKKSFIDRLEILSDVEQILKRPGMFIGSMEVQNDRVWVYDEPKDDSSDEQRMSFRPVEYVPALYKLYDEILVNAADNKAEDPEGMNLIKVTVDAGTGRVTVWNNGAGIPVEIKESHGLYAPECVFGVLRSGTNYDDAMDREKGGQNGLGSKLANIFSSEFSVEIVDAANKKKYVQHWRDNMSVRDDPKITSSSLKGDYVQVSFVAQLERFGLSLPLSKDYVALLRRRALDMAGILPGVRVLFNGETLKVTSFKRYAEIYGATPLLYEESEKWKVGIAPSSGEFCHASFVNGISTPKGGTHVNHVVDRLVSSIVESLAKKKIEARASQIKAQMMVFVACTVSKPTFDSQTKDQLTLKSSSFTSKFEPSDAFIKKLCASDIGTRVMDSAKAKAVAGLSKTDGGNTRRVDGLPKLEDANWAGTAKGKECTLILTEGDSAKALAVAGLVKIGRDKYGVYPLRGKMLNTRGAAVKQIMDNEEIKALKKILGLEHGKNTCKRYGSVCLMVDRDADGFHIACLFINMCDTEFPGLLEKPGFLKIFVTPLIKMTKGEGKKEQIRTFMNTKEADAFLKTKDGKGWEVTYLKGLGSSDISDAKRYFSDLGSHLRDYAPLEKAGAEMLDLVFNKKRADDRKGWLCAYDPNRDRSGEKGIIEIPDFINHDLIEFSMADNIRSFPSAIDGLKPSQRKVLYAAFTRKLVSKVKVAAFGGFVTETAAYHHGEASLHETITKMAQNFCGSNNINLFTPDGMFGTRAQGGEDASSPRYIFTRLERIARALYPQVDDAVLNYLESDGQSVEPEYYVPVIAMALVNGANGIGTGWRTAIPGFNPRDVIAATRAKLDRKPFPELTPWARGFIGTVEKKDKNTWNVSGIWSRTGTSMRITELPVGLWTQKMKEVLEASELVKDFKEFHGDDTVDFRIDLHKAEDPAPIIAMLSKQIRGEYVCFDDQRKLKVYDCAEDIIDAHYPVRLALYEKRRLAQIAELNTAIAKNENRVRFINEYLAGRIDVAKKSEDELVKILQAGKYEEIENLLKISIRALTLDNVNLAKSALEKLYAEKKALEATTPSKMWHADLVTLEKELKERDTLA